MGPDLSYLKSAACAIGVALAMLAGSAHAQQVPIPQTAAEVRGPAPAVARRRARQPNRKERTQVQAVQALKRLKELESFAPPGS